jgi:hypothetical protein
MTRAFLDTTILANALLKIGDDNKQAKASFARYEELLVSGYAVKEFKAGPLRGYVWLHNKVVTSGRWGDAIAAISTIWQQRNLSMTATRAVGDFTSSMGAQLAKLGLVKQGSAPYQDLLAKEARIWLKTKITKAWKDQKRAPFKHVNPLSCYALREPIEMLDGLIEHSPLMCTLGYCCLHQQFTADLATTEKLELACKALAAKPEMNKRRAVLHDIGRKPKSPIDHTACIRLGDAVFALQCPSGAVVLTTNLSDHGPLCAALGKTAEEP